MLAALVVALLVLPARISGEAGDRAGGTAAAWGRAACLALLAAGIGLGVGSLRLREIDSGALRGEPGAAATVIGEIAAVPRRDDGEVEVEVSSADGRLLVRAREPQPELAVGAEVGARGVLVAPDPWLRPWLERRGIASVLEARELLLTGAGRGGLAGRMDGVRARAEAALERGMPEREAALARGFVLGQDDRIDPETEDDFRRSGLAHLLAVSGQNVLLLALLAWPLLALCGLTLRARLLAILALIAIYVPVTGAGPSIQRAGVMGAAAIVAALASRPASRWYALLLAAAVTLALNPRAAADVGWQLSFAAVLGIMLWGPRLASLIAGPAQRGSPRQALAEGAAATVAATVATAPLAAHHFEAVPLAALPANLLALPAVAPAMWLGMLAAMLGQVPALPVEPLNWLDSLCLAYIAAVADWLGEPGWAVLETSLGSPLALAGAYLALGAGMALALGWAERRAGLGITARGGRGRGAGRRLALAVAAGALLAAPAAGGVIGGGSEPPPEGSLRVTFLDVGQGDAILLDPPGAAAVLVDAGPERAEVAERLRDLGVESLAAAVVTHDQSDHSGGLVEVLEAVEVERLALARAAPELLAVAAASGVELVRVAEGAELRSGGLRLSVLWPPGELLTGPVQDPNALSMVLLAEWRHLSILLTGDAEAEAVPLDPGPVDLLKVAHHGSEDAGLASLLDRVAPKLAVISVGSGNGYGHPAPPTLRALRRGRVAVLRTDQQGEVTIEADREGWTVDAGG